MIVTEAVTSDLATLRPEPDPVLLAIVGVAS